MLVAVLLVKVDWVTTRQQAFRFITPPLRPRLPVTYSPFKVTKLALTAVITPAPAEA